MNVNLTSQNWGKEVHFKEECVDRESLGTHIKWPNSGWYEIGWKFRKAHFIS